MVTLLSFCGAAQQPQSEFEVASVKLSAKWKVGTMPLIPSFTGGPGTATPTRLTAHNQPLRDLLLQVYGIQLYQFSAPPWLETFDYLGGDRFDIDATVPPGSSPEQFQQMLRNLLAHRFGLVFHREQKEFAGYALVTARGGPKMNENLEPAVPVDHSCLLPSVTKSRMRLKFTRYSMEGMARILATQVKRPVVDKTGLKGFYDCILEFRIDLATAPMSADGVASDGGGIPDLFAAVQDQLGLKLVAEKVPVDLFIVDRINRQPTDN